MADLEYTVTNQGIATTKTSRLVSGTIGVYTVKFTFNNVWDGLEKWATFDPIPGTPYKQPLDANGECTIPGEVMGGVYLRIGVFGLAEGQAYPTIWASKLPLEEGCFVNVPPSDWPEPSPLLEDVVKVSEQTFTDAQKVQARTNIGAAGSAEMTTALAGKVDKPEDATPGNVAVIGSNNNISDSGISKDNLLIAPQLASNNVKTDSIPYTYRQTGGGIGVGNREYDSIVGGSVVWNQLFETITRSTSDGITTEYDTTTHEIVITNNSRTSNYGSGSTRGVLVPASRVQSTHKYIACFTPAVLGVIFLINSLPYTQGIFTGLSDGIYMRITYQYDFVSAHPIGSVTRLHFNFIDLTELLGSTVADRLYAMEQASAGSGVAYFKKMFPKAYYAYTATPSLESVSGLSSHQMKDGNGDVIAEYPLDDSLTLRGVAVTDADGNIKFDGDEYAPDGTVTRRYAVLTIDGTGAGWYKSSTYDGSFYLAMSSRNYKSKGNVICAKLITVHSLSNYAIGCLYPDTGDISFWFAEGVGKTLEQFKAWLSSNPFTIIYEVNAPTTETAEPYDSLQICDPLGTEEYVTTGIVPVGHNTRYPENQVAKLDGLPSDFSRIIAPTEIEFKATRTYTVGRLMIIHNVLYKAKTSIAIGATLTVGTNIEETTLDEVIASL